MFAAIRILIISWTFLLFVSCSPKKSTSDEENLRVFLADTMIKSRISDVKRSGGLKSASYSFVVLFDEDFTRREISSLRLNVVVEQKSKIVNLERFRHYFPTLDFEDDIEIHEGTINSLWVYAIISEERGLFIADRF